MKKSHRGGTETLIILTIAEDSLCIFNIDGEGWKEKNPQPTVKI